MAIVLFLLLNLYRILFGTEPLITKSHEAWIPGFAKTVFQGIFYETVMILLPEICFFFYVFLYYPWLMSRGLASQHCWIYLSSELCLAYLSVMVCSTELAQHAIPLYIRTTRVVTLYVDDPS